MEPSAETDCRYRVKLRLDHCLRNKDAMRKATKITEDPLGYYKSTNNHSQSSIDNNINFRNKEAVMNLFEDEISIVASDMNLALSMSSIAGLTDLVEDEVVPKIVPFKVKALYF